MKNYLPWDEHAKYPSPEFSHSRHLTEPLVICNIVILLSIIIAAIEPKFIGQGAFFRCLNPVLEGEGGETFEENSRRILLKLLLGSKFLLEF